MKIVKESLEDFSFYENQLYESVLNEKFNIVKFKEYLSKVRDKNKLVDKFLTQLKGETTPFAIKKNIGIALIVIYLVSLGIKNNKWEGIKEYQDSLEKAGIELAQKEDVSIQDVKKAAKFVDQKQVFKDPSQLTGSRAAINLIKKHEGLSLKAYKIGDGMITIGYGHAEPENSSKFKVGDKITKHQAEELFLHDLSQKHVDLQRMFKQWKERGSDIKVTQSMYDALLSMAFNMGISGLRNSDFIEDVEDQNFQAAADKITKTRINKKFPGLEDRRQDEYDLFIKDMT